MDTKPTAVFFDVDGVLVDSLPAHLSICRNKAAEYGLNIKIPSVDEFRKHIIGGATINPMIEFFAAVGFPPLEAARAVIEYERDFADEYRPPIYVGAERMLQELIREGWTLGIVTSNTKKNIEYSLGESVFLFDPRCIFTLDKFVSRPDKTWCLLEGAKIIGSRPRDCFFVGDLPSDASAAGNAGFNFIAALYGWGLSKAGQENRWVDKIEEIPLVLRRIKSQLGVT